MPGSQEIQQCINQCNQLADKLRSIGNTSTNQKMRDMILEGAHHIDLCVTECGFASSEHSRAQGCRQQSRENRVWFLRPQQTGR